VTTCPKCGGHDVRLSSHVNWITRLRWPLGQRAFRCRTCRVRFYASPDPSLTADTGAASHTRRPSRPKGKRGHKRRRRWIVEALIFAAMLLLFWLFLRYLTREQPAPTDITPTRPSASDDRVPKRLALYRSDAEGVDRIRRSSAELGV
jgi:hypothetical protein